MRLLLLLLLLDTASTDANLASSSARCVAIGETPDARVGPIQTVAPGAPPLLSFRYYEGRQHGRYGNMDLMLDDAGH